MKNMKKYAKRYLLNISDRLM